MQAAGGSDRDEGNNIAVDGNGNVYAVGTYTGTAQFGKVTKTSQGPSDVFVVRIDK
ncbi:SBBP repeat-containing protein [Emticicia agri]|uniref:SBBP repeat-containing protein n=1 Tax=Emticicia agri TaxID=2492393 RepID=UPI0013EC148B|nr:SBBP repeat-containing protein [Emticicia agri]